MPLVTEMSAVVSVTELATGVVNGGAGSVVKVMVSLQLSSLVAP